MSTENQVIDASQARAMLAYQQQMMHQQLMDQQVQMEMHAAQQRMQLEAQYQQQLVQQQQQMQQQYLAANLTADDVRRMMQSVKPGESFEVEMYQGFEVHHKKQQGNTAQILVALILAVAVIVMALQS